MRRCIVFVMGVFAFSPFVWAQTQISSPNLRSEVLPRSETLQRVDYEGLWAQAKRRLDQRDSDLKKLLRRNLWYLINNRLNRARFLSPPHPQDVVDRVTAILALSFELDTQLGKARELVVEHKNERELRQVVRQVGETATQLCRRFKEFFLEVSDDSSFIKGIESNPGSSQSTHFLLQSEWIQHQLEERIQEYFLNPKPGVVDLSHYREGSIAVLCESLRRLSRQTFSQLSD